MILNDILDFSKIESRKLEKPCSVAGLLQAVSLAITGSLALTPCPPRR
jgi:hypothetical protein